jgi:hypothetical protein
VKEPIVFEGWSWQWFRRCPVDALKSLWRAAGWYVERMRYGYSEADLYGFRDYLDRVLSMALADFAEHHCGRPASLTAEEWTAILRQMAADFEAGHRVNDLQYRSIEEADALHEQHKRGLEALVKWYGHLWD